ILIHTLEKFCLCARFDALFVGVHKEWLVHTQELLTKYRLEGFPIHVLAGGETRNDTIVNVLDAIEAKYGTSDEHVVVTHDAVRPFVKLSTIEANINAVLEHGACDTVIPATDTIVYADERGVSIQDIPDRSRVYQGQTPQSFGVTLFRNSLAVLDSETRTTLTDACKVLVEAGHDVYLVEGDVTNIKLTTIMDYKIAKAMIESGAVDK
ncbi:MAG: D-ribitol-5-phosphate cytidylyltransferase, partial [Coriobacteriales bacterium]|nr:D-ribitol-5-phosphate cytidylyltransferase [Coriobacteriales bacterium]